ncbi:MAG: LPS export ABC transporter permease LptF [Neisseriaceae bacterium]|nr:LPS export ABC transporter permease LptF [Neisseriaceae bacterium]
MIYRRHLMKELTLTAVGVFLILLIILISTQVINLLGRVAGGRVAFDAIGTMLAVWVLGLTPLLLILTVFVSVLTVFARYWRDSEMVVWLATGLSLKRWLLPVGVFITPFVLLTAVISLSIAPWAEARGKSFAGFLKQKQDLSLLEEGVFKTRSDGSVYFVGHFDLDKGVAEQVFVRTVDKKTGRTVVVLAQSGVLADEDDKRILRLQDGNRYSGLAGQGDFDQVGFQAADLTIAVNPKIEGRDADRHTATNAQLWASDNPNWHAELMWRWSMPLTIPVLALLALSLSYSNPRHGKSYSIIFAAVFFFIYQSLLTFARTKIGTGQINFWVGLLPAHLIMFIAGIVLLRYRDNPLIFHKKETQ